MSEQENNTASSNTTSSADTGGTKDVKATDAVKQSSEQKEPSNPLYNKDGSSAKQGEESETQKADAKEEEKTGTDQTMAEGTKEGEESTTAPEKYADFKLPEGLKTNPEVMTEFQAIAKEKNLSQADAQKLVDVGAKMAQNLHKQQTEMLAAEKTKWESSARADKEFGGDKFDENLAVAKKGFNEFMSPEGRAMLHETGLGSHPEIIRAFYRAGKAISEDNRHVQGDKETTPKQQNHAKTLYPNN